MEQKKVYMSLIKASLSYAWKKHAYMTTWITVCILAGICRGIANISISELFLGIITGMLPLIIKGIGRAILSLDSQERADFYKEKMRKREAFTNYIKEYIEKCK